MDKTEMAKELAEDLGMHYIANPTHEDWYVTGYGTDLRDYKEYLMPRNLPYDDKDFIRDPTGPVEGSADRYLLRMWYMKYVNYCKALRHIFNTGQGVITESNPWSDYVGWEAAYNAGWIARTSRKEYYLQRDLSMWPHKILRPNLVIYLDAPVDIVRRNIKARNNEWDKNSPVWANTQYLNDMYNQMKREYLKNARQHSLVLVYDWSEKGDVEVVVEDIERLNFDIYEEFDDQQTDWRLPTEDHYASVRWRYSSRGGISWLYNQFNTDYFECEHLIKTPEENENMKHVSYWMPGERYSFGYNRDMGDSLGKILFNFSDYESMGKNSPWIKDYTRPEGVPDLKPLPSPSA